MRYVLAFAVGAAAAATIYELVAKRATGRYLWDLIEDSASSSFLYPGHDDTWASFVEDYWAGSVSPLRPRWDR